MFWRVVSVCVLVVLWALFVWAMLFHINVDGVVCNIGGTLFIETISIKFFIYGEEDGSDLLWEEI